MGTASSSWRTLPTGGTHDVQLQRRSVRILAMHGCSSALPTRPHFVDLALALHSPVAVEQDRATVRQCRRHRFASHPDNRAPRRDRTGRVRTPACACRRCLRRVEFQITSHAGVNRDSQAAGALQFAGLRRPCGLSVGAHLRTHRRGVAYAPAQLAWAQVNRRSANRSERHRPKCLAHAPPNTAAGGGKSPVPAGHRREHGRARASGGAR